MAKMLSDNGIDPMHSTTIAKIEAGERSVRINEAVGIAELFGVSLDFFMGRRSGPQLNEVTYALRVLRESTRLACQQVWGTAETLHEHLEGVPSGLDGAADLHEQGNEAWNRLISAFEELVDMAALCGQLLDRQQTKQAENEKESQA